MATRAERDERAERRAEILAEAYVRGRETLRRQAGRNSRAQADVDEVMQEACLAFLRCYEGPPGKQALRYLMVVVKHTAWANGAEAWWRASEPGELTTTDALFDPDRPRIAPLCDRPGPAERSERRERRAARIGHILSLKPDQRRALLLLGLGYSYREIAAACGWTYTKVNRCLSEGRAALRALAEGGELAAPDP